MSGISIAKVPGITRQVAGKKKRRRRRGRKKKKR